MKIGIYGGTFNPVHIGHLLNAQYVKDEFALDTILFVPSKTPVHKNLADQTNAEDRCRMLELAIQGNSSFKVSRIEIDRAEPSYTILTVREIAGLYPEAELYLILGADSFYEINIWKDHEKLLAGTVIIVLRREGDYAFSEDIIRKGKQILFSKNPIIEISSSAVRSRIKRNNPVDYYLPDTVVKYIKSKGLYKN